MPIQKFEDILPEEVYEHTIGTAEYLLSLGGNEFCTNRWWDFGIRKDSFPVFVHNIYQNSELHNSLKKIIEEKTQKSVYDNNIMLYYWTRYSYIPWHNDNVKYEGAITIYLNREWEPDFGGYFLYEEGDEIKAILPKKNLGVMQYDSLMHSTTPVNFSGDLRFTVQAFLGNK
jgi:Rps23 Pro-64 3,4-dihydroxylase Tpa1-like proline 4-hydroxylase